MTSLLNKKINLHLQTNHKYHLVDPSPWPIFGSLGGFCLTIGGVGRFFSSTKRPQLSHDDWLSFNFEWCFFCFRFEGQKDNFFYGLSNDLQNVPKKLWYLKTGKCKAKLLHFIVFNSERNLHLFHTFVNRELESITKALPRVRSYNLEAFVSASDEQISDAVLGTAAVFSKRIGNDIQLCPAHFIHVFNKKDFVLKTTNTAKIPF